MGYHLLIAGVPVKWPAANVGHAITADKEIHKTYFLITVIKNVTKLVNKETLAIQVMHCVCCGT